MPVRFVLVAVLVGAVVSPEELGGVRMPDEVALGKRTLTLNGMAIRTATVFKIDVYVAGLYLEHKTPLAEKILRLDQPIRIHMEYLRSVKRKDIAKAWVESFEDYGALEPESYRERLDDFLSWLPAMARGETTTFTYLPENETLSVHVNQESQGDIVGADFAGAFFRVWFAPDVPYPNLRDGLLGKKK